MSLDLPILEVYGMSESTGPQTLNVFTPGGWKLGSAGRVISGCELMIHSPDDSGDGEVSVGRGCRGTLHDARM